MLMSQDSSRNLQTRLEQLQLQLQQEIAERRRLEAALQASDTRYKAIVNALPDMIFHFNRYGTYLACHAPSDKTLIIPPEELIGKNIYDLGFPQDFVEQAMTLVTRTLESGENQIFEYQLTLHERKEIHEARIIPLTDEEVLIIVRNITERKQAETALRTSEERFRAFFDHSPAGLVILDTQLRYVAINPTLAAMNGLPVEAHIGKRIQELFPVEAEAMEKFFQHILATGEPLLNFEGQGRTHHPSRPVVHFWANYFPLVAEDGRPYAIGGVVLDITEQKQVAEELNQAKEAAERANRAKSIFLSNMNHELRTPLNIILGNAQILKKRLKCASEPCEEVEDILRSGEHLLTLLNDLLDLAKLGARQLALQPHEIYFPRFLRQLTSIPEIQAREKALTFCYEPASRMPLVIEADEKRLRQVLLNLLTNAVRFTEQGTVTFRVKTPDNQHTNAASRALPYMTRLRFEVEDTGIGMTTEQTQKIFLPFEQLRSEEQWHPGTGAGLAISQHLVRLMRSELRVVSAPGQGSLFWFEIELTVLNDINVA